MKVKSKEDKTKSKRNMILMAVISVPLIITIIGITYAWFSATVSGNDTAKENVVENATLSIKYTNSNEIKGNNIVPGWSETKTFTVENAGTATATYSIAWANLLNEFVNKENLVYTLTSNNNGGTLEETIMPDSGENINILSNISIESGVIQTYTLTITYKNQNRDQTSDAGKKLIGKIEVKEGAAEASNKFKIELKVNKGSLTENQKEVNPNDTVEFDITNVGYGNPTATCTNGQVGTLENNKLIINNVTSATECAIVYNSVTEYTLTYDLDGGALENPINNYTIESEDITLPNPLKEGYTFDGWTTEDNNIPEKNITIPKGSHEDKKYIANYTPIKYEVTFNANGGQGSIESSEFTYDKKASLPESTLTKEGYVFVGWSTNPNATEAEYEDGEEVKNLTTNTKVTLYAVWAKEYKAELNTNGAEQIGDTNLKCIVKSGDSCTITLPNITPKDDFEVVGWATNQNATTAEANAGDAVTINNDTTYYAITKSKNPFTAVFKDDCIVNLIDTVGDGEITLQQGICKNLWKRCYRYNGASTCDIITPDFTRENWIKIGWGAMGTREKTHDVNAQITLSANLTRFPITKRIVEITYDANGGSGAPEPSTGEIYSSSENTTITISSVEPQRDGYEFLGWSEDKNATASTYDKGVVKYFSSSTKLYAVWKLNTHTANVTVLNGTVDGATSKTVSHGNSVSFKVYETYGYGAPKVECTNNQEGIIEEDTLFINNLSDDTTCTVEYRNLIENCYTFNSSTKTITKYNPNNINCPTKINIPSQINNVDVKSIGQSAFNNKELVSVTIPNSVTTIGDSAFYNNNITSLTIGLGVTTIGEDAFYRNQLTTVTIPSTVTTIGNGAFYVSYYSNPNLTKIINKTGRSFLWKCKVSVAGGDTCVSNVGDQSITASFTTQTGKTLTVTSS